MKTYLTLILFLSIACLCSAQSSSLSKFFDDADVFFSEYVEDGKIAYKTIKAEPTQLENLVEKVGTMKLEQGKSTANKAFLINTYNLMTIYSIIQNGIPKSPLDVKGFFDEQTHKVARKQLTLDQIEKEMLIPVYNDSRIHFVLVCAALGCPPIKPFAYVPDKLDQQIEKSTVTALNSDYFIRVESTKSQVLVSELFKWYKEDFLAEADSILAYINSYRKEKIASGYKIGYYNYDWSLNKQ